MDAKVQVSIYENSKDTRGIVRSLSVVIQRIQTGDSGLAEKTQYCNALALTDPKEYKEYKENKLLSVTFAGTFPRGKRKAEHISQHSGLIVLDIDGLTDAQITDLLAELAQMPQVVLAFISPSGKGIKVVVSVTPRPENDLEHKGGYHACLEFFDDLATEYGFEIDTSGKDCSRLCFLSHDPRAIVNTNAPPIDWDKEAWLTAEKEKQQRFEADAKIPYTGEVDITVLDYIDPHDLSYNQWLSVITACKIAGLSCQQADAWSRRGGVRYTEGEVENRWHGLSLEISWGAVVNIAKANGYNPRQRAKLTKTRDAPSELKQSLEVNRGNREAATDTFLETETDTLHLLLVKDTTGTGKTHTLIAKAQQHGKRSIAQLPHSDLAKQAVEIAREHGYKNPFHLVGREHNWEKSGIAQIPIDARTPDLFARNNCIMVDEIKKYTDKRLAPRTYCEHRCPFRDECPHLEQYQGLGQRDFVATCTPNLLFDLNMRGYLQSLVTATDETSDEELAIDAMMGTESETQGVFDLAILDDYGINGLYTDITFSQSEFKALKKAWSGTPTAKFANLMLKAFKKKKPQKIVKALRNAFESIADTRDEITKALTQHARNGTVEYAEYPKSSKETQRLLSEKVVRYTDGGRQFIAVDFDAYKELTEKGIATVHPQHLQTEAVGEQVRVPHAPTHALIAGVPIKDLTPVWQNGATPIELLNIFLKSIGNDNNAPINRAFRAGDPPVAVLTFSIPPQAPIGILPQIAMLSATTDTEATQRTFDGQAVTFSEHTGAGLDWAEGVQVYQFQDGRLTSSSVFEYPTDIEGHRKLQEAPIGLKPTAEKRLRKLNDWAKATDGLTAFISYKEFTEHLDEATNGFDIVTHFDKVAGLNFDGLKYLVVFGYPKVKHEVVMEHARKQYAGDSQPLPTSSYEDLTEETTTTEHGITSTERTYKDLRLETIRHQLATEKLEQAIGRARLPVWEHTTTLIFTAAPVPCTTERATLFSSAAFNLADTPNDIASAMNRIQQAEDSGDVQAVMEVKGVSQSTGYRHTEATRKQQKTYRDTRIIELHQEGKSQREIERVLKHEGHKNTSRKAISKVVQNSQTQLELLIGDGKNAPPIQNTDDPCLASETAIIKQLNEGIFDRLAISEKLAIDVEVVRAVLGELLIVDPRLTVETQQKLKKIHQSRRPPALPPAHERPPPWIPPEDWEDLIESRYRAGASITEIADAVRMPEEMVQKHISEQHF